MDESIRLGATIAIGVGLGLAVGAPVGYVILDHALWVITRRKWKEVDRKAKHKANAMVERQDRKNCARCGHPKDRHSPDPIGCQVDVLRNGATVDCECENYLEVRR